MSKRALILSAIEIELLKREINQIEQRQAVLFASLPFYRKWLYRVVTKLGIADIVYGNNQSKGD